MGKREKLLEKARNSPQNLRFEELCSLAESFGFTFARQRGTSHRQYKLSAFERTMNFQRGKNGKAITYQVNQLIEALSELGMIDDEEED